MGMYKRNGVYYAAFQVNGKRIVKSTGARDLVSARAIESDLMGKVLNKQFKTLLLSQAIDRCFEERWCEEKCGEETRDRALLLLKYMEDKPINEIGSEDVQMMKSILLKEGKSLSTINRYMSRLKTILMMGMVRWGILSQLPYIPLSKEKTGRIMVISKDDEMAVINLLVEWGECKMADLIAVLADTGMRLSEALELKRTNVNFSKNLIHVLENKTDLPRSIPMTKRVIDTLTKEEYQGQTMYFYSLNYNRVQYLWNKVRVALGITDEEFVIHALRHTYASRLVQSGYDLYKVKTLLGHSSIKMTERYAHLLPVNVMDSVDVLERCKWDEKIV